MVSDLHKANIVSHPLIQHKISSMRDHRCEAREFGQLLRDCGALLGYEATKGLEMQTIEITTPRGVMKDAPRIKEADPVVVAVMRAGLAMAEGLREIFHRCRIGHIGLSRIDEGPGEVMHYYSSLPTYSGQRYFVVDPIIATGRTITRAVDIVKDCGAPANSIAVIALIAARAGIEKLLAQHQGVTIFIGAQDEELDQQNYLVPGIGDVGDRLFGTV
jgi:uracil phosphoribosyltransferase